MRDRILEEIRRLAALNGGQAPGQIFFASETGVAQHHWRGKFWARWGDALVEAGFEPNQWQERLDSEQVLTGIIAACRHYGRMPTQDEIAIFRKSESSIPSSAAIKRHFNGRRGLISALAERAAQKSEYADIAAMLPKDLPAEEQVALPSKHTDGFVYLIQSGDYYKVGRSDDLERRVKEIRIALPDKATLVHSIRTDDPAGIEAYWHRRFAEKRRNGEWFKLHVTDVSAFKKRKFQ